MHRNIAAKTKSSCRIYLENAGASKRECCRENEKAWPTCGPDFCFMSSCARINEKIWKKAKGGESGRAKENAIG